MPAQASPKAGNRLKDISFISTGWFACTIYIQKDHTRRHVRDFETHTTQSFRQLPHAHTIARYQNHEQSKRLEKKLNEAVQDKMREWQHTIPGCSYQDVKVNMHIYIQEDVLLDYFMLDQAIFRNIPPDLR